MKNIRPYYHCLKALVSIENILKYQKYIKKSIIPSIFQGHKLNVVLKQKTEIFSSHSSKQCQFINNTNKILSECLRSESLSQMIKVNLYHLTLLQ